MIHQFTAKIDHAQTRRKRAHITSVVSGLFESDEVTVKPTVGWDPKWGSEDDGELTTYVDPVTGTLMLRPGPLYKKWDSTGSGIFARLAKSAFTFNDSAKWEESNDSGGVSKFLVLKDSAAADIDRKAYTTATYPANTGWYVAFRDFNWGDGKELSLQCGYNSTASDASGVSIKWWKSGQIDVLKDGVLIKSGSATDERRESSQSAEGTVLSMVIIPCRHKELLIITNRGGAFNVVFDDIEEDDEDPEITGATSFWFYCPNGKGSVEVAPLRYATSGWRASIVSSKLRAPSPEQVPTVYVLDGGAGTVTGSVVERDDPDTEFVPDGSVTEWRIRVDIAGDGNLNTFVYAALADFPAETAETPGEDEYELTNELMSMTLTVPENPAGVQLEVTVKSPETIDPGGDLKFAKISNRPFLLTFGESANKKIIDGTMSAPKGQLAITDDITFLSFTVSDAWKRLEDCRFTSEFPLDGFYLHEAIRFVMLAAGFTDSQLDIETSGLILEGPEGTGSRGDWQCKVEIGDTAAQWIERIHETYAATWFYGFVPGPDGLKFRFISPEELGEESVVSIYESLADIYADVIDGLFPGTDVIPERDYWKYVCRTVDEQSIDPECNQITVTGLDIRKRRPIIVEYNDEPAQDPELSPYERGDNWSGDIIPYGFQSPLLTTRALCEDAVDLLRKRLCVRRYMIDVECEMLLHLDTELPVWRGHVVTKVSLGRERYDKYRVISFNTEIEHDPESTNPNDEKDKYVHWRPSKYLLELIQENTAKGVGGKSFETTAQAYRQMAMGAIAVRTSHQGDMRRESKRPASYAGSL